MAPKRSGVSAPSTPTKKRKNANTNAGQPSLAAFLSSPSQLVSATVEGKRKELPGKQWTVNGNDREKEDEDALFALKLAARDAGLSLTEMRRRLGIATPVTAAAAALTTSTHGDKNGSLASQPPPETRPLPVHPLFQRTKPRSHTNGRDIPAATTPPPVEVHQGPVAGPSTPKKPTFDLQTLDAEINAIDLTEDVLQFNPASIPTSAWPHSSTGDPITPYALLSHAFITISSTRSRLLITTVLTNTMRVIKYHDPSSLLPAIYLVSNHIAPNYDDVQLGIGGSLVTKAIKSVTGKSAKTLKTLWDQTGDPGDVAFEAKKGVDPLVKPSPITVQKLFSTLHVIASLEGAGSMNAKLGHVTKLLVASRGEETRWLVRTFQSHLRIGAVKKTLSGALARCFSLIEVEEEGKGKDANDVMVGVKEREGILANPTKSKDRQDPRRLIVMAKFAKAEKAVREVFSRHPNFTSLLRALLHEPASEGGLTHLSALVPLRIGTPISPMLGSITRALTDVYTKLGVGTPAHRAFVSEFKYDGQRVQIHAKRVDEAALGEDGKLSEESRRVRREADSSGRGRWMGERGEFFVRLFSRHLEDMSTKYPDLNNLVPLLMSRIATEENPDVHPIQSFIIDAEVVAIGTHEEELLPFQTLANRSRKDVDLSNVKVRVGLFAFDLMYLDGASLLKSSFRVRRRLLHTRFPPLSPDNPLIARFAHVKSCESNEPDEVEKFFAEARGSRCEGIMVKTLDHHWQQRAAPSSVPNGVDKEGDETKRDVAEEVVKLEQLGDVVADDLTMEEDDEVIRETAAKNNQDTAASSGRRSKKGNQGDDENGDAADDVVGKGVSGRGKALLSTYEPDKRCESWLKVKKDYVDGMGDSLDLVPIAGWHGMGRKAQWWSPVLLAVYDAETGTFSAVCKCISGFTDKEYVDIKTVRFPEENHSPDSSCYSAREQACRHEYDTGGYRPDVWFEPREVWEIRGADITISPVYPAARGLVHPDKGLSIRFPRFIQRRMDKGFEEASTPGQLAKIYFTQNASRSGLQPPGAPTIGSELDGHRTIKADAEEEEGDDEEVAAESVKEEDDSEEEVDRKSPVEEDEIGILSKP